ERRRLSAAGRHALRRLHRLPPRRGPRRAVRPADFGALRAAGERPRLLRRAALPPHRVLPRPRARRAGAVRRRARAGRRRVVPRSLARGPWARAEGVRVPTKADPRAATPPVATEEVDVRSLEHELRRST